MLSGTAVLSSSRCWAVVVGGGSVCTSRDDQRQSCREDGDLDVLVWNFHRRTSVLGFPTTSGAMTIRRISVVSYVLSKVSRLMIVTNSIVVSC